MEQSSPVEVYCRLRPGEDGAPCVKPLSNLRVQLVPPASSKASKPGNEQQFSFTQVIGCPLKALQRLDFIPGSELILVPIP